MEILIYSLTELNLREIQTRTNHMAHESKSSKSYNLNLKNGIYGYGGRSMYNIKNRTMR